MKRLTLLLVAAILMTALAAPAVTAYTEATFDQLNATNIYATNNVAMGGSLFVTTGTVYARTILSPTIDQLWAEIDRRGDASDARIVELQAQIHDLQNKVTDLQRRLTCVENKPNQVRPKCPTS